MQTKRAVSVLGAAALVSLSVGCGSGGDGAATATDTTAPPTAPAGGTISDDTTSTGRTPTGDAAAANGNTPTLTAGTTDTEPGDHTGTTDDTGTTVAEPGDDTGLTVAEPGDQQSSMSCPEISDEFREMIDGAIPEAPAPGGLADTALPADQETVIALFDALPDELIGGNKDIMARTPSDLGALYQPPDHASQVGFQAADLRTSFMGSMLPEPRADMFVALWVLSDDDDFAVESSGHDGDLYWVTFVSRSSGYGIDGTEHSYIVAFGEACRPWGFSAAAPSESGRDELIAAFVAAAGLVAATPDPTPATPDERAAQAALLTLDDLGSEWLGYPDLPIDELAFHDFVTGAMADEPSCERAHAWVEREGVVLTGLLDVLATTSVARAESPTFVSGADGREVAHTVIVFENAELLDDAFASTRALGWVDCTFAIYDEVVQAQFPGLSTSVLSAAERSRSQGHDDVMLRFELVLEAPDGSTLAVTQDISIVAVGRAVTAVFLETHGDRIDDDRTEEIISLATGLLVEQYGESN